MKVQVGAATLELVEGDIAVQDTEGIVNAANSTLLGGGGVDGAIHRAGGPAILDECRLLGGCRTGDAKVTLGGNLRARYVIHAVGPVYTPGQEERSARLLASAYRRCLELAVERGMRSLSFPSISTGAYGYPMEEAAPIALRTVGGFLAGKPACGIDVVRFVLRGRQAHEVYEQALRALAPGWSTYA